MTSLEAMLLNGAGYKTIVRELHVGSRTITRKRIELGLPPRGSWSDERAARLKELVADKQTASQIATVLGVTRNAVIGKVHRLGIELHTRPGSRVFPRPKPIKRRNAGATIASIKSRTRKLPPHTYQHQTADVVPLGIPFMETKETECHWPLDERGDDGLILFCGHPKWGGCPYCVGHSQIAYQWRN